MESNFMKQSSAPIMENNSHDIIDRRRHTQDKQDELSANINAHDETMQKKLWTDNTIGATLSIDTRFRDNHNSTKSTDLMISLPNPIKKVV